MSSISAQLSGLQSTASHVIQARLSSVKSSLLYSDKDAASLDYNALHTLANKSLDELTSSLNLTIPDDLISTFFSKESLSTQRLQLSKSHSEKISSQLKQLLKLLQPYALNTKTLHLIEWLIQRFYIEKFDTDTLMWFFLPYFDQSALFCKLSRGVFKEIPDKWYWLLNPFRESASLSFGSILRFAYRDESFLPALGSEAKEWGGPLAITFFKVATKCVLNLQDHGGDKDALVEKLFPFLIAGLGNKSEFDWWKICLLISSAVFARLAIDDDISAHIVTSALKNCRKFDAEEDGLLLFEVYAVNQTHEVKNGFPGNMKKQLLKIENWVELLVKHDENARVKGKNLCEVFKLLSLDKQLLEIFYPKIPERLNSKFVKSKRMALANTTPVEFISLNSGDADHRRKALEQKKFTQEELHDYILTETDSVQLTAALKHVDSIEILEKTLETHYPSGLCGVIITKLKKLNPEYTFYYQLFEKTLKELSGRKFKVGDTEHVSELIEKVSKLSENKKFEKIVSLFLRCVKTEQRFSEINQKAMIKIFESLPPIEAGKFVKEYSMSQNDDASSMDDDESSLLFKNINDMAEAKIVKILMASGENMDELELSIARDKFLCSLIIWNLENKERELALQQFKLLAQETDYFQIALAAITGKGALGKKSGTELRQKLVDFLKTNKLMTDHHESILAGAYQSYLNDEKHLVQCLDSEFQCLRLLALRSMEHSNTVYHSLCGTVLKLLDENKYDNVVYRYADYAGNMELFFKIIERIERFSSDSVNFFTGLKLNGKDLEKLIELAMVGTKSSSGKSIKMISKILNNHDVGLDTLYKKVKVNPAPWKLDELYPELRFFLEMCVSLNSKTFTTSVVNFIMQMFERATIGQDILLTVHAMEEALKQQDLIKIIPDSHLRIDLLVGSLQNPSIAENIKAGILELLTKIANKRPSSVLDHVMTVLTALGSLQTNDIYSVKVCADALEAIIPPLFESVENIIITGNNEMLSVDSTATRRSLLSKPGAKKATTFDIASKITRTIASTCRTIPQHRKQQVLTSVNKSLSKYSWVLICELVLQNNTHDATQNLMVMMSTDQLSESVKSLISVLKDQTYKTASQNQNNSNTVTYQQFCRTIINVVNTILSNPDVIQFMRDTENATESEKFLTNVLNFLYQIRSAPSNSADQKLEKSVLKTLQLMIILLRVDVLINSLEKISEISSIRTTFEKLAERIELISSPKEIELLTESFPTCVSVLMSCIEKQLSEKKQQANRSKVIQLGILAMQNLIQICCEDGRNTKTLIQPLLPALMEIMTGKHNKHVRASAMLCLAEMTKYLQSAFIPFLEKFIKTIEQFFVDCDKQVTTDQNQNIVPATENIICWSLKALHLLIENVGYFLSQYIAGLMVTIGNLTLKTPLIEKRLRVLEELIALHIPMRVFFPKMVQCIQKINNPSSLIPLMKLTKVYLQKQSPLSIKSHLDKVKTWAQTMISVRETFYDGDEEVFETLEEEFALAFLEFIKKLEESTFPSIFYKLFLWACDDFKANPMRTYSFYHVAGVLAGKLKSIFVSTVALQMVSNINSILVYFSEFRVLNKKSKNALGMLSKVMHVVQTCCAFDRSEFVKTHLFDACGEVFIDLVAKTSKDDEFREKYLAPCIATMCLALSQSGLGQSSLDNVPMVSGGIQQNSKSLSWKTVHYQILQRTRYQQASERKAAVEIIFAMAQKLGQEYTVLMPEAVPFFAELLEDDSEVVEKFTRECLVKMEDVLGESMQQYF